MKSIAPHHTAALIAVAALVAGASSLSATPLFSTASPHAACVANGTLVVEYDSVQNEFVGHFFGNSPYPENKKSLVVDFDDLVPGKSKICIDVLLLPSASTLADDIRVKFQGIAPGLSHFQLGGETDPKKQRGKSLTYMSEPTAWEEIEYPKDSKGWFKGKEIKFKIEMKLGTGGWQEVDPDIIIIKPGG